MLASGKYTKELSKLLKVSGNILLVSHINPDGDAIGSQLALYHFLRSIGKNVSMISPNNLQEFLKWMDGVDQIKIFIRDRKTCKKIISESDLIIMLDFNQPARLGEAEDLIMKSDAVKVIIDHHLSSTDFADLNISDTAKCSTAELLHEIICTINEGEFVNKSYAESIYVGIVTDTGNFDHGTYTGNTFRTVASLLEAGIEKERIYNLIYSNFSADRMKLLGFALYERMVVLPEYRAAYIWLSKSDLTNHNYQKGDTEGFVNIPLSISGIVFSTIFIEKEGFVKLSFRSKGSFSVNDFAEKYFSGGGHMNASGGEHTGNLEDATRYFLEILKDLPPAT